MAFSGPYAPGSIVIDTSKRKLYYVLSTTSAYAYSIGVGRQGFGWTGKEKISRIADWPDWYPPADMRQRKPNLPKRMLGGIRNPLGAKAIYLGNTLMMIGIGLASGILWFILLGLVAAFATQKLAIEREERHLDQKFGKRWRDYSKKVRRWI